MGSRYCKNSQSVQEVVCSTLSKALWRAWWCVPLFLSDGEPGGVYTLHRWDSTSLLPRVCSAFEQLLVCCGYSHFY